MSARTATVSGGGKKVRQSGIELLRILAMLAIIAFHIGCYSGLNYPTNNDTGDIILAGLFSFGKFGVALFFMITGYFLCAKKSAPQPKRVIPIVRLALFYYLAAIALCFVFFPDRMVFSFPFEGMMFEFAKSFIWGDYWFISAYVIVMILAPYIKKMLDALSDREITRLCLFTSLLASIGLDILRLLRISDAGVSAFALPTVIVYLLIGYTIKRREKDIRNCGWATAALIAGAMLIFLSPIIGNMYASNGWGEVLDLFRREQSIGTMLASVGCFIIFSRIKLQNRFVNYVASLTLAVYLIHNNTFVIWSTIFRSGVVARLIDMLKGHGIISGCLALAVCLIATFVGCAIIEIIRRVAVRAIAKICTLEKTSECYNKE
jgi:surface polysaccharide O-acyltransferase-like enzyme